MAIRSPGGETADEISCIDVASQRGKWKTTTNMLTPLREKGRIQRKMQVKRVISVFVMLSSVDGFNNFAIGQNRPMTTGNGRKLSIASMVGTDDEVAALRAAAQKAREEAQKLAKVCLRNPLK